MILRRRHLRTVSQADIAYDLGVILPPAHKSLLPKSHAGHRPRSGWGTRINLKKYSLSQFFSNCGYPLRETFLSASHFSSTKLFGEFLADSINKGNDLLVCFNYPLLYRMDGSWGHASLVQEVKGNYVLLCDPGAQYKNPRKVLLHNLFSALNNHYGGGVWTVSSL